MLGQNFIFEEMDQHTLEGTAYKENKLDSSEHKKYFYFLISDIVFLLCSPI